MGQLIIWLIIAIVFGITAGLVFNCASRKEKDSDTDADVEETSRGHLLLTILIFIVVGFLIVWLITSLMGWKIS